MPCRKCLLEASNNKYPYPNKTNPLKGIEFWFIQDRIEYLGVTINAQISASRVIFCCLGIIRTAWTTPRGLAYRIHFGIYSFASLLSMSLTKQRLILPALVSSLIFLTNSCIVPPKRWIALSPGSPQDKASFPLCGFSVFVGFSASSSGSWS